MVPIPIDITHGAEPFTYDLSIWKCKNAVLKQIVGSSRKDLDVRINVVQKRPGGYVEIEPLRFLRQISPTSWEINHLIEDCSNTYLEISTTAGSNVKLMLLYE